MEHNQTCISRHMLIMILCCAIPMAALAAIFVLKIPVPQVMSYGLVLLCPLGHILMMAFMGGHKHDNPGTSQQLAANTPAAPDKSASCH